MILALRTDTSEARLFLLDAGGTVLSEHVWEAQRTLARDLLKVIHERLEASGGDWASLTALICYRGPGSFTGLRIAASVMNTLAHTNRLPIVGSSGDDWVADGLDRLRAGDDDKLILPDYGAPAHITQPKK